MKKLSRKILATFGAFAIAAALILPASASTTFWLVNGKMQMYDSEFAIPDGIENLSTKGVFSGDNMEGVDRGLECLNDTILQAPSGNAQGWVITKDYIAQNGQEKTGTRLTLNFAKAEAVSSVAIFPAQADSGDNVGYGMPSRFKLVGTLASGKEVVLCDYSNYDYESVGGTWMYHRFNFELQELTSISLVCLKAGNMPDPDCAYWLTEFVAFNDTESSQGTLVRVDITQSKNLAFRTSVQMFPGHCCGDRPAGDLTDMAVGTWGGCLLFHDHLAGSNISSSNPVRFLFQFQEDTEINQIRIFGFPHTTEGLPKSYRIVGTTEDGTRTVIYDTSAGKNNKVMALTRPVAEMEMGGPAVDQTPLQITFTPTKVAKLEFECWEFTDCADPNVAMWLTEMQIFNTSAKDEPVSSTPSTSSQPTASQPVEENSSATTSDAVSDPGDNTASAVVSDPVDNTASAGQTTQPETSSNPADTNNQSNADANTQPAGPDAWVWIVIAAVVVVAGGAVGVIFFLKKKKA